MSTLSYEQEYAQLLADLNELQMEDAMIGAQRLPESAKDKNTFYTQFYLSLYVRYLTLSKKLIIIYDAQLQPQKLSDIRILLDSCLGRMLEVKQLLVENAGDFILLDDLMQDLKLSPDSLEPPVPSYILDDRKEEIQRQKNYIASLQEHYAETDPECLVTLAKSQRTFRKDPTKLPTVGADGAPVAEASEDEPRMPLSEAVKVLQISERGRQARQRAKFQLAIFRQQQYAATAGKEFQTLSGKDKAATLVQKVAMGFLERERAQERYKYEKVFLGMKASDALLTSTEKEAAEVRAKERKNRQNANVAELQKKTIEIETNLKANEGPKTIETMLDEVLMHMAYARLEKKDGELVEVPPPEEGGTLALLGRDANGEKRKSLRRQSSQPRPSSARRSTTQPTAGKTGKGEETEPPAPTSHHWDTMKTAAARNEAIWQEKVVEGGVEGPTLDEEMLKKQLLDGPLGVMTDLRACVDQLVMIEVNNLKEKMAAEKKSKKKREKKEKKPKKAKTERPHQRGGH